jgi:lycopene cyclase domain-containing protein
MQKLTYLILDVLTIAGPLALSFDKRVAFFKDWKFVFTSIFFVSLIYLLWDVIFTALGIWQFNPDYLIGINFINLPWEEVFFFVAVPYACLFIYACLRHYLPNFQHEGAARLFSYSILIFIAVVVGFNYNKLYTAVTGIFLFFTILNQIWVTKGNYLSHVYLSWIIGIIPMCVVNGFLTSLPILIYNNTENLGIRVHTLPLSDMKYGIPIEDFFYNLLYMMLMIWIFETRKNRRKIHLITPVADGQSGG